MIYTGSDWFELLGEVKEAIVLTCTYSWPHLMGRNINMQVGIREKNQRLGARSGHYSWPMFLAGDWPAHRKSLMHMREVRLPTDGSTSFIHFTFSGSWSLFSWNWLLCHESLRSGTNVLMDLTWCPGSGLIKMMWLEIELRCGSHTDCLQCIFVDFHGKPRSYAIHRLLEYMAPYMDS